MNRFRMQASTTFGRTHLQDDRLLLTHARPKDRGHVIKWSVFPLAVAPRKECFFAKNQFPNYSAPPRLVKRTRMAPINLRSVLPGLLLAQSLFMSSFTLVTCNNVRIARSYRLFELSLTLTLNHQFRATLAGDWLSNTGMPIARNLPRTTTLRDGRIVTHLPWSHEVSFPLQHCHISIC